MPRLNPSGKWVFVSGASSGLGQEMARQLAHTHRANLVVAARRLDRLQALKAELEPAAGVQVVPVQADLSVPQACHAAFEQATENRTIYGVILNAGVTYFGEFLRQPVEDIAAVVNTNVMGVALMSRLFLPHLVAQRAGGLMLVSSTAGAAPLPYQGIYGGTKAFVTNVGCAVAQELKGTGVGVTVFAPGGIATEMSIRSGTARQFGPDHPAMMKPDECARQGLEAFLSGTTYRIPGLLNRAGGLALKMLPRGVVMPVLASAFRKALPPPTP